MTGRKIWSCVSCTILLVSSIWPRDAAAMYQGTGQRDTVHRIFKVKVTEDTRILTDDTHELFRRKVGSLCPASYSLCAAELGGNCCPENYACAKSSCYATTAAVSTCQGRTAYYACPQSLQGGCCPQGLLCASDNQCLPPSGATYVQTCPTGFQACPSSLNYGCCASGMACGATACYSVTPSTSTITYTTTEGGSAVTVTSLSVTTPSVATAAAADTSVDGAVIKFFPTTVAKTTATSSPSTGDSGGGGLSKGAIGGIVAVAAILLLGVFAAAFFIIKRLKRTEKFVQTQRETTSGTRTRHGGGHTSEKNKSEVNVRVQPTPSEVDAMDYDPLMMNSSVASPLRPGLLQQQLQQQQQQQQQQQRGGGGVRHSRVSDSDTASQGVSVWSGTDARWQTPSLAGDSDAGHTYFELPPRSGGVRDSMQSSNGSDGAPYYYAYEYGRHGRNQSNASELSAGDSEDGGGGGGGFGGGRGSPRRAAELDVDGAYTPELPGSASDTETENTQQQQQQRRRGGGRRRRTASINHLVSPISVMSARPPQATTAARMRRQRQDSLVSPMEGAGGGPAPLGSIDESAGTMGRGTGEGAGRYEDLGESPIVPGMVSIGPAGLAGEARPSHDSLERR